VPIITAPDLNVFFYQELIAINKIAKCPLPTEFLFYSSKILETYSLSEKLYRITDQGVREKILGEMYLKANNKPHKEKIRILKEVGDISLLLSGYFAKSLEKKIVDRKYYKDIGKMAYSRVDDLNFNCMNVPNFFKALETCFDILSSHLNCLAAIDKSDAQKHLLISNVLEDDQQYYHRIIHCRP
jgi:hypothetical protein